MKAKLIAALIVGSFVLAGCAGGSDDTARDDDMQVADPQQERIDELERLLADAQEDTRGEKAAKEREQADKEQLEKDAEEATARANLAEARPAFNGLAAAAAGMVSNVTPKYGSTTTLTATPTDEDALTLQPSRISSLSGWSGTALSSTTNTHKDDLVVYSNIGRATRVSIPTKHSGFGDDASDYNPPDASLHVEDITGGDAHLIRSSAFPTVENDPKDFDYNYDGNTDGDPLTTADDRYRVAGTYDGASGHFECDSGTCTVTRLGNRYVVTGTWKFYVLKTRTVSQDDQSYMYFGWWRREQKSDGMSSFATFFNGMYPATTSGDNDFDGLIDSATYRGPAVGQYAIYQPAGGDSSAGSFHSPG